MLQALLDPVLQLTRTGIPAGLRPAARFCSSGAIGTHDTTVTPPPAAANSVAVVSIGIAGLGSVGLGDEKACGEGLAGAQPADHVTAGPLQGRKVPARSLTPGSC
ncbi:hypothetical protein GCM10025331_51580 [Actinoplanes utahensis]|nr:hypothetical protein Aut01nite_65860 [Actinoplanes utahensis]